MRINRLGKFILACSLASLLLLFGCSGTTLNLQPRQQSQNIVNGLITVQAGGYNYYIFNVDTSTMHNVTVTGSFQASGGSGNDIVVAILDSTGFTNFSNGHTVTTYYNSGQMTVGSINASLTASGEYYLLYENTFSILSSKNVTTSATLQWN